LQRLLAGVPGAAEEPGRTSGGGGIVRIIGVDASLTGTGIAILQDGETTTERLDNELKGVKRLVYLRDCITRIAAGADLVTLEGYAFARPNQAHQIGELGGVLRVALHEAGIKVLEVAPAAVKKFATGKGNANKEAIAVGVFKRWKREFATNDETDAFVLAQIGQAYLCGWSELVGYQREVMVALNTPTKLKGAAKRSAAKKGA
jgi:crossover junction endodeoxyribonuclease RuvC